MPLAGSILLVSNPPHGAVDARRAAPPLGLTPAEATLKLHYPVPEIWLAFDARAEADKVAQELLAAGLHLTLVAAAELGNIPARVEVASFAIHEAGLVLLADQRTMLGRAEPLIAVFCAPREAGADAHPPGGRPSEAMRASGTTTPCRIPGDSSIFTSPNRGSCGASRSCRG